MRSLSHNEMPLHNHTAELQADGSGHGDVNARNKVLAGGASIYSQSGGNLEQMNPESIKVGSSGGGQEFSTLDPYLGMNYIIALEGVFPRRG